MIDMLQDIITENVDEVLFDSKEDGSIESFSVKGGDRGRVLVEINGCNFLITIEENNK